MEAVQAQAGEVTAVGDAEMILVGKHAGSLGPIGPILRAVGIGFGLGLLLMAVVVFTR
jgi:hypothetical protein